MVLLYFIIVIFAFLILIYRNKRINKITVIEKRNSLNDNIYLNKQIINYFIVFHVKYRKKINITRSIYFIEHNSIYDDLLFLIPLYNIIINTKIIVICSENKKKRKVKIFSLIFRYILYNNCIYFNITFLKWLHIHSNIFRFCKFNKVYQILQNSDLKYNNDSICKTYDYKYNYSIITTVYKRNNLQQQLDLFFNQTLPPKHVIIVHDRNMIKVQYQLYNIIYYHTINFAAGFYFRYLISLLSPDNDVIMYDDDWLPYNKSLHLNWINKIKVKSKGLYSHHTGNKNGLTWCATPLIIHRKWLYLMWYHDIYESRIAEDAHLSFSLLLICNIKCITERMNGLNYKYDNLSSSKSNISHSFWQDYTIHTLKQLNSHQIMNVKEMYNLY